MKFELLQPDEVEYFREIDRREVVKHIYYNIDGQLELRDEYYDIPYWAKTEQDEFIDHISELIQRGGKVWGAWDGEKLVGMITLDSRFIGDGDDLLNLNGMWVSRDYRQKGIASKLMKLLIAEAKDRGAKGLYVSATPSKNTVEFYQHRGFELTTQVDPQLYELEPEDIHMIMKF